MQDQINHIKTDIQFELKQVQNSIEIDEVNNKYLSKKGIIKVLMKQLKDFSSDEKLTYGQELNKLKEFAIHLIQEAKDEIRDAEIDREMQKEWVDSTIDQNTYYGTLHPVTLVQYELEEIFEMMGFQILDGPHIENEYYNFEALNIPPFHPARDMQDTFFFENGLLLRTQTSDIQIRGMEKLELPLRIVGPGKVFRAETIDASHECVFHQLEGMVINTDISVAHLIHFMQTMLSKVFQRNVKVRLRPGYFPFVEPGFELDISCQICDGAGCRSCKQVGWIELLGCGMTHPNVLKNGGIDPNTHSGFAFGMGIDRLAMMKYGIHDIRLMHSADLRFISQFQ